MSCRPAIPILLLASAILVWPTSCRTGKKEDKDGKPGDPAAAGAPADGLPAGPATPEEQAALAQLDQLLPGELPTLGGEEISDQLPGWDGPAAPTEPSSGPWMRSGNDAIARAQAGEKPIVFWIGDKRSATDVLLAAEVCSSPALQQSIQSKAVGLRVDYSEETVSRSAYYKALRDRFKPRGAPTVLVLQPDGTETARYTGYSKGTADGSTQRLAKDLDRAAEAWQVRKRELGKSGFRTWTDRSGRSFFGKAVRRDGEAVLMVDAFRHRYRVDLDRFTNENLTDLLDILPPPSPPGGG